MPYYEYRCAANDRTIEVRHGMSETLTTWGQVAEKAGTDLGGTPADSPVEKLMSTTAAVGGAGREVPFGCGSGCGCVRPQ